MGLFGLVFVVCVCKIFVVVVRLFFLLFLSFFSFFFVCFYFISLLVQRLSMPLFSMRHSRT